MAEQAPLIFAPRLGGLYPVNPAAREAMKGVAGQVTIKITRATRNQRRRSLYWVVTGIVADLLNDMHQMTLTENDLHDMIRKKLGYYDEINLPSGDVHIKLRSTSDKAMAEPERAVFTDRAFKVYSAWLGVPVDTLIEEGKAA